jgi:phage shock protein PspC (stress-responsive transcriptional regulator)
MNKVLNINLGGYPFTIDDDGFEHLENYLDTIHSHFKKSDGYEEITSDIEARMAELFQEQLNGRSIVTIRIVETCIGIMGTPEEFGAEGLEEEDTFYEKTQAHSHSHSSGKQTNYQTGKKLFRDPDDSTVGGVCSGIAAYFGIEDPLWVRLLFVLGFFSGTIGLWAYIILWAIIPEAKSAGDRLAMKGETINVSNIGRIIEDEIDVFADKLDEIGSELGSKKKAPKKRSMVEEAPLRRGFLL